MSENQRREGKPFYTHWVQIPAGTTYHIENIIADPEVEGKNIRVISISRQYTITELDQDVNIWKLRSTIPIMSNTDILACFDDMNHATYQEGDYRLSLRSKFVSGSYRFWQTDEDNDVQAFAVPIVIKLSIS